MPLKNSVAQMRHQLNLETVAREYARVGDDPLSGPAAGAEALKRLREYGLALLKDDERAAKRQAKAMERLSGVIGVASGKGSGDFPF